MSARNTKICPHCGASLPREAAFCPRCASTLLERQAMPLPRRRRRWGLPAACLVLAAIGLTLALWHPAAAPAGEEMREPPVRETDPYLAACQTYYTGADGREYHVFAAFSPQGGDSTVPVGYLKELVPEGMQPSRPATVFVTDALTGANANEAFSALMEDSGVTVTAEESVGRVQLQEADYDWTDTGALLFRVMKADSSCARNEVVWTLRMKNGDAIELRQTVEFSLQETVTFDWRETEMNTAAELQAVLDGIARQYDADTLVKILLPSVAYDAAVHIPCAVELRGSDTVFCAPVTVGTLADTAYSSAYVRLCDVTFRGAGGTGLSAAAPTYLERCRFSGWDVAAQAVDGGWVFSQNGCTFSDNGTALRFATAYTSSYGWPQSTDFTGNTVALQADRLPADTWLVLDNCRFSGNETDIENPNGYRIDTDTCRFE